jgi:hypothetical protein
MVHLAVYSSEVSPQENQLLELLHFAVYSSAASQKEIQLLHSLPACALRRTT